jgi:hypothetical protein
MNHRIQQAERRLWRSGGLVRSATRLPNGDLQMTGLGVVFSALGGVNEEPQKDFYGTWFSRPSDILDPDYTGVSIGTDLHLRSIAEDIRSDGTLLGGLPIGLFYDHGVGPFGALRFGTAVPLRVTQEGLEYLITVERRRAREYLELVADLQSTGDLGLSTQTAVSVADFDWKTGLIRSWMPIELSLTPTPAETRTYEHLRSVYKKYGVQNMPPEDQGIIEVVDETVTPKTEEAESPVAVVDAAFDALDAELANAAQDAPDSLELVEAIGRSADVEALQTQVMELQEAVLRMGTAVQEMSAAITANTDQTREAFSRFAGRVAEVLAQHVRSTTVRELASQTRAGAEALDEEPHDTPPTRTRRATRYNLPANAPGL